MENWRKYSKDLVKEESKLTPDAYGKTLDKFGLKGSGGLKRKAILDMLSAFVQPKGDKAERMGLGQDHLLTTAEIPGTYFRERLLDGPDYTTTNTDYRSYKGVDNNPVSYQQMVDDLGLRPEVVVGQYDFFDYILKTMVNMGLLRVSPYNEHPTSHKSKYMLRPAGAKMFKKEFDAEKETFGEKNVTQLGRVRTPKAAREPSDAQLGINRGREFDPGRYTER